MKLGISIIALNVALVGVAAPAAFAQKWTGKTDNPFYRSRYVGVTERQQPAYDPLPMHVGAFDLRSSLGLGAAYNDNIFATENNTVSDTILNITPRADLTSNWSSNAIGAGFMVNRQEYLDNDSESVTDYNAYLDGRLDVTRALSLGARVDGGKYSESRYAPSGTYNPTKPVRFDQFGETVNARYRFSRIQLDGDVGQTRYNYDNPPTILPGNIPGILDQGYRDRVDTNYHARASYAISPSIAVYLQGRYTDLNYGKSPTRDSNRTFYQLGTNFELAAPFRGDIAIGYVKENQDLAGAPDTSGLSVDGRLQWFVTQITNITFTGERTVFDPGLLNSSVAFNSNFGVHVDHELRRNIILFGDVGYGQLDFQDIDRKDKVTTFGVGAGYKVNRHARLDLAYTLRNQDSTGVDRDRSFDQNIVSLALKLYP